MAFEEERMEIPLEAEEEELSPTLIPSRAPRSPLSVSRRFLQEEEEATPALPRSRTRLRLSRTPSRLPSMARRSRRDTRMPSRARTPSVRVLPPRIDRTGELLGLGYVPLSRVETSEGMYLKALNPYGQYVFIEEQELEKEAPSQEMVGKEIPYEISPDPMVCAASEACKVAYECKEGLCTLRRSGPTESLGLVVRTERRDAGPRILEIDGIEYPLVRWNDLQADPTAAAKKENEITKQVRNAAYEAILSDLKDSEKGLNFLVDEFNLFNQGRFTWARKLLQNMKILETLNEDYLRTPPQSDEVAHRGILLKTLRKRNDQIIQLIQCSRQVAAQKKSMEELTQEIRKLREHCSEGLCDLPSL